ncbi:ankyrin repeat domain-containing protein [Microbispora hainanensis]|uniref:Ankryin n=1 Tax=Microbispora hainanensis TaxID=568844 RepID=A0A544XUV9_9ACTN|nr:ankyrin repeat domain-containing protein [Microbispora hainanensis]TQS08288.1 ankryin [Microbispora hainanensis]
MTRSRLLEAIAGGDVARVAALLHPDTAVNPAQGTTPLYRAAVDGHHDIVRLLLEYGADPDQPSGGHGEGLPLCAAACWNHAETVQALLDGGADPDAAEEGGWTPLLWAAANGNLESADILLDAGADPGRADDDGDTPLTLAAVFGAYGIVWSLLEHGADPSAPGWDGMTPLEIATRLAAVDVEAVLREEVSRKVEGEHTVLVAHTSAADGTRRVTVEARGAGGDYSITRQQGHAAIATVLEAALGLRPPPDVLLRRVLPYRDLDEDDETWWAAVHALQSRHDEETFLALTRLCESDDPVEREFGVDVLAQFGRVTGVGRQAALVRRTGLDGRPWSGGETGLGGDTAHDPYRDRVLEILRDLARHETDPAVVEALLRAFGHQTDERALPEVLKLIDTPGREPTVHDPMALAAVLSPDDEDGLAALIRLSRCADDEVRDWATMGIAGLPADTAPIRDALVSRLADRDLTTVAEAARGLAGRGDRRAIEGVHRVLCEAGADQDYARDLALEAAQELGLEISGA